ncbi:MAG: hypothetical protein ACK41Q_07140 [Candidatus Brocadia sp.]
MHKRTWKMKRVPYKVFLLSILVLFLFSLQSEVFSKTGEGSRWNIQGHALKNTANTKNTKSDSLVVMGTFATADEPTTEPIPLKYEYPTFSRFYVGIVIVNNSDRDKDVTVTFELFGVRNGKEDAEFTVPGESTFLAYIDDTLGRPGFYTYKVGIKNSGSSKITLMLTE